MCGRSPFHTLPSLSTTRRGEVEKRNRGSAPCISMQQQSGIFTNDMLNVEQGSKTYLVGADIKRNKYKTLESTWSVQDSLAELERLSETAGLEVVGSEYQVMQNPSPATFIGEGKLAEMVEKCRELEVTTVIRFIFLLLTQTSSCIFYQAPTIVARAQPTCKSFHGRS